MKTAGRALVILCFTLIFILLINAGGGRVFFIPDSRSGSGYDTTETLDVDSVQDESYLFQSVEFLSQEQIYVLIDSLLNLPFIPEELITEIRLYVNTCGSNNESGIPSVAGNEIYPGYQYYPLWDEFNTHSYPDILSKYDTSITLVLADSVRRYIPPFKGRVTSGYGYRAGRNHNGVDIDLQVWDTVVAAFDGMVRIARKHGGYGRLVVIRHFNGLETFYAHLHRFKVKPGQLVTAGEIIGFGGKSGRSTGSHLHFEMRFKGQPLNPKSIISFKENKLIKDTVILRKTRWSYAAVPKGIKYYRVIKGDCLFDIAQLHGTSVRALCEMNSIRKNSLLRVGQTLRIN